ncbi:MAG: hypothetical protein ABIT38_13780 [Gemmatimonadaceae bacterium]
MTSSPALVSIVLLLSAVQELAGQRPSLGVGVNTGTMPRALEPLCASARRLRGVGLSASGGTSVAAFRVGATLDYVSRVGVRDAADCVPRIGTSVDSTFAAAGNSATSISVNAWAPAIGVLSVGAEGGWVLNHASWFVGPAVGLQVWRFRTEVAVRRHTMKYEEITRVFESPNVRELSRIARSEKGWGTVARVLLMVF